MRLGTLCLLPLASALGLVLTPGCEETPEAKSPASELAQKRHDKLEAKLALAKKALSDGHADQAREIADQARAWADESEMMRVLEFVGEVDRHEGTAAAEDAADTAAGGDCTGAIDMVSRAAQRTPRPRFLAPLREVSEPAIVECLEKEMDRAIAKGDFDAARTSIERTPAKVALGAPAREKLAARLHDAVVHEVAKKAEADAAQGRYDDAVAKLEDALGRGVLHVEDEPTAYAIVQAAAAPREIAALTAAIGSRKKPAAALAGLDAVAKTIRWTDLPPDMLKVRTALATWVECLRLKCSLPKPAARFTYGTLALLPGPASAGASAASLPTAKQVWIVGRAGKLVLLASEPPNAGAPVKDRFLASIGWVPEQELQAADTTDWLPPGDGLKGQRVFGPLREKAKLLYLGFVMDLDGDEAKVKRMGEDQIVTLPRSVLRIGRLTSGQKVLAACPGQPERTVATVDQELPLSPGAEPHVRLSCPGADGGAGFTYDEFIGAIAVEPDWVPAGGPAAGKAQER